jgi:hypothetical protein
VHRDDDDGIMLRTPLCDLLGRTAAVEDRLEELLPFTGQSVALVHDVSPAGALVRRLAADAAEALHTAGRWGRYSSG